MANVHRLREFTKTELKHLELLGGCYLNKDGLYFSIYVHIFLLKEIITSNKNCKCFAVMI